MKTSSSRYQELRTILGERQRELQADVQGEMTGVRTSINIKRTEVLDSIESAEADVQEDIAFTLVQIKLETLNRINEALARLELGNYGNCGECGVEIAEKRLRALPFAVRCKSCEEAREATEQRERELARRRPFGSNFLFDNEM